MADTGKSPEEWLKNNILLDSCGRLQNTTETKAQSMINTQAQMHINCSYNQEYQQTIVEQERCHVS